MRVLHTISASSGILAYVPVILYLWDVQLARHVGTKLYWVSEHRSGVLPCLLGLAVQRDRQFGSKWPIERLHLMKVCESYAELQTYKWSIIRDVLKERLEKLPTVKPVASTVSWSDVLQQVGELCQNTAEESEGNTVEISQQHSSQEESSQSDTDTSTATVQEMSSLGNTNSSKVFATQANTEPTSVNEKPGQFDE